MTGGAARPSSKSIVWRVVAVGVASTVLGAAALVAQMRALGISRYGYVDAPSAVEYVEQGNQWDRHIAVLDGVAPAPWQYRVLSPWINQRAIEACAALGVERPVLAGFLGVRLLQNIAILGLAAWFYRRSGLSLPASLLGISILAAAMAQAVYDSDLATNTYFDLMFYLVAALLVLERRLAWVIPVVVIAALNRETSIAIPLIMLAGYLRWRPMPRAPRRVWLLSGVAVAVFVVEYFLLWWSYGARPLLEPYGVSVGIGRLAANVTDWRSWFQWLVTFGIVPVLSVFGLRSAPLVLRNIWVLLVPVWFGVHLALAVIAETRLFLVPMALAFIPCSLFLVTPDRDNSLEVGER